jgi:hypothetical protein
MATNEELNEDNEYVTKADLRSMLSEILGSTGGSDDGDDDGNDGWEVIEDAIEDGWEVVEDFAEGIADTFTGKDNGDRVSSSDIERIAEQKVQEALRRLAGVKKPAAKKAPAKKEKPEPEAAPTTKKTSFGVRLWGDK